MQKTPFIRQIEENGGRIVEFAGFALPVSFDSTGIIEEHKAVRNSAGLFDVSHMGELFFEGPGAFDTIQKLVTNDITGMTDGRCRYSLLPNDRGGIIDDIIIYRFNAEKYMIVVNAANTAKAAAWFEAHLGPNTQFRNASAEIALLAMQGPEAYNILREFVDEKDIPAKRYTFKVVSLFGHDVIISRTGYTGEDGFEFYCGHEITDVMFSTIMENGKKHNMILAGLGARDTLRMEAGLPLYGHEMSDDMLCTEVGMDWAVKMSKETFPGKDILANTPAKFKRLGIKINGRGIAREHTDVFTADGSRKIGMVTSGTFSPTLGCAIGMIRIEKDFNEPTVMVNIRGKQVLADVVSLPFYQAPKK